MSPPLQMCPQRQGPAVQPLTTKADVKPLDIYVNELCCNWERQLTIMLSSCTTMAMWQERWALVSTTLIIVLNVLVVAAPDIHLKEEIVTIIVIVNSVLKTIQLRCKFAVRANELHESNAELQTALQKVRHIKIKGRCLACSFNEVHKCEALVEEAINHIPPYAFFKQSLPRWKEFGVEKGSHEQCEVSDDEACQSGWVEVPQSSPVGAQGPMQRWRQYVAGDQEESSGRYEGREQGVGSLRPFDALEVQQSKSVNLRGVGTGDVEAAAVGRQLVQEGIHNMELAATIDTFAAGTIDTFAAGSESLHYELHKRTIEGMLFSVDGAVTAATFFSALFRVISYVSTTLELIMNVLIMTFNEFLHSDSITVAIFAAAAAVLKGIEMKLEMDTKQKQAELVLRKFVVLQEFIKQEQCNLTKGPLDPDDYEHLLHQYQTTVSVYAVWLPVK